MTDQPCYSVLFITMAIESVTHDATMGLTSRHAEMDELWNGTTTSASRPNCHRQWMVVVRRGINKVSRVVVVEEGYKRRCC